MGAKYFPETFPSIYHNEFGSNGLFVSNHGLETDYKGFTPKALSLGLKRPAHETNSSSPSSAEVMKGRVIPSLSHMPSWHCAQLIN
jgi:hypothetical protein